jgi:hypothetical protein
MNEDYIENTTNGPGIRGGSIDASIGYRGGVNGGAIGGADASGDMYRGGDVTSKGDVRKFRQTVGRIKYKESQKRRNALKKLKELDDTKYDSGELKSESITIVPNHTFEKNNIFKNDSQYFILDNGGLPFIVNDFNNDHKNLKIYKNSISLDNVKKVFTGGDNSGDKNSSLLVLNKDDKYVYIGSEIYEFKTDDKILKYSSKIGNSAVPYPFAIGSENVYIMLDKVYFSKKDIDNYDNIYDFYYKNKDKIDIHKMKSLKILQNRL